MSLAPFNFCNSNFPHFFLSSIVPLGPPHEDFLPNSDLGEVSHHIGVALQTFLQLVAIIVPGGPPEGILEETFEVDTEVIVEGMAVAPRTD